ncbi:MAG: 3-methyl-2-oxobutanoate hydroxymethyltransferase [Anaerolineales bacterium]|nr:3-methyl-2-oxobutanoate hydroxymethyltransferase [Anaerolineales bacterium]MCB9128513.1 3-methyl-2-oxobutanoate hydroxymethyltransferase [Ardenticatenales bacterium]
MSREKVTILDLQQMKERGEPITMITAYDYPSGILAEQAGVEMILVGDTLGMVVHGFESTVQVTMEMMILHCAALHRAKGNYFVVGDMPFGSYEIEPRHAVRNAIRLMQEGFVDAVKLEGGREMAATVRAIVDAGISVHGHIGLTPQSVSKLGGFKAQGKTGAAAKKLLDDALALEDAGCFAIVLEAVPDRVAAAITERLRVPTIGIGAGAGCSGQVLVWHDMLGLFDRFTPKFVQKYGDAGQLITDGLSTYVKQVKSGEFPTAAHSFTIKEAEWQNFQRLLNEPDHE